MKDQSLPTTTPTEQTTQETKPEVETKPEPTAGAPEKYTDFKLPEGFKLDDKVLPQIQTAFKDMNLTQDQAQSLVDLYAKVGLEASQAPYKAWADTQKQWSDEIATRFGDKADTIRGDINSAINTVLSPSLAKSFRAALDLTGAGTNPDLVEGLSLLLKPHFEGKPVPAGKPSPESQKAPNQGPPSLADAMYGHLRK